MDVIKSFRTPATIDYSMPIGFDKMKYFGMLINQNPPRSGVPSIERDASVLLALNAHFERVQFALPKGPDGTKWVRLLDTDAIAARSDFRGNARDMYSLNSRSMAVSASTV